jgi:rare lipoprotein A
MFGFRFFWTLGMALCLCLSWGQAYAANFGASDARLVAAANVNSEKAKKGQSEGRAAKAQASAKAGKQVKSSQDTAKTQAAKSPPQGKRAVKPATASPNRKASATPVTKHKKHGPLPPASADLPQRGIASWVGKSFEGGPVAVPGERHVMESFTAAHRAIAFHTVLKVTDIHSGRSVLVRVNDRGPYIRGRVIDLARAAAEYLGYAGKGLTQVHLELVGNDKDPAQRYYIRMRSAKGPDKTGLVRGFGPFDKLDEAAALFIGLYKSYPDAELLAVRETS